MEINKNEVKLAGLIESMEFSHENHDEKFYTCIIGSYRASGSVDHIPVVVSEKMIDTTDLESYIGKCAGVYGDYRSYNQKTETKTHLILNVFALGFDVLDHEEFENEILLEGYVTKTPVHRKTPNGRIISDIILAVNKSYQKSSYIPCIAWGRNAIYAKDFVPGDKISITGRIQSREYVKRVGPNKTETRVAYEVSITKLDKVETPLPEELKGSIDIIDRATDTLNETSEN